MDDQLPTFFIGQHETQRSFPVTERILQQAKDCNYDMLTTSISTPEFQDKVWNLMQEHALQSRTASSGDEIPMPLLAPFVPSETHLQPGEAIGQLLVCTSPWIDICSPDPVVANVSRQVLNQEVAYAAFCGAGNIIIHGPTSATSDFSCSRITQFARAVQEVQSIGIYVNFQILLPMDGNSKTPFVDGTRHMSQFTRSEYADDSSRSFQSHVFDSWDAWNVIRTTCRYSNRISIALAFPFQLPTVSLQTRWLSEPVRILVFPKASFKTNAAGFPALFRNDQSLLYRFMRLKQSPWILLSDVGPIPGLDDPSVVVPVSDGFLSAEQESDANQSSLQYPTPAESANFSNKSRSDPLAYLSYMRMLERKQPEKPIIERWASGYQDYLQAPLQPLADNLESITYETFEKDPIKYDWYGLAIHNALIDWANETKTTSSSTGVVVIAVVGAGRGPLVTRALKASESSNVPVKVYAVEKNPNAYVLLQHKNNTDWNQKVTVVKSDMRSWQGPDISNEYTGKVDILVSELLGSFGDNELSPECLDGVQHVLNPVHGISIPSSYTAHLSPLAAPKLYADILTRAQVDASAPEIPHVVMLQAVDFLSVNPAASRTAGSRIGEANDIESSEPEPFIQLCWAFRHPIPTQILEQSVRRRGGGLTGGGGGIAGGDGANEHNTRFWTGIFPCTNRGVCHGLAGWFETVLYRSSPTAASGGEAIELSTNPENMGQKSKDMISWFPIYFPLKSPMYIPDGSELEVSMWRQTNDKKVWYEWIIESFVIANGHRLRLGISDLHSSKKNGCLM